jgi:hypothetical protein
VNAHIQPTLASRLFLIWRWVIEIERPDARVTGADPGVGLQPSRIDETGAVIADLGEHARPIGVSQPGAAGDHRVVGMGLEKLGRRLTKLDDVRARGVERGQQRQGVYPED